MNLHMKIVEIRKTLDYFQKSKKGQFGNFVPGEEFIPKIKSELDRLSVLCIPEILEPTVKDIQIVEKGSSVPKQRVSARMRFTFINAEKPEETLEAVWFMSAADGNPMFSLGKAITFATRIFYLNFFCIPTGEQSPEQVDARNGFDELVLEIVKQTGLPEAQAKHRLLTAARVQNEKFITPEQFRIVANDLPKIIDWIKGAQNGK